MDTNIILISEPNSVDNEFETVVKLFDCGLQQFNIRKPNFTENEMRKYLQQIPKQHHKFLVLHSHYCLAKEFNLKGIHLGIKTKTQANIYKNKFEYFGYSAHSFTEILENKNMFTHFFISPVFNSISKQGYMSNFRISDLQNFVIANNDIKIIALGGIDAENIQEIKHIGFCAFAVLGAVWQSKNRINVFLNLKNNE